MTTPQARILAVDDDEHTRALLSDLVTGLGHTCALASDGKQALERIAELRPDLVLLDLMMPALDGFGVLERIRQNPETADLPVILITAIGDIDGKIRGLELGADDYLTKPFKLFELTARLNAALSLQRYRQRLKDAEEQLAEARGKDTLTGAGSYAQLRTALDYEVARARRYSRPLSALLLSVEKIGEAQGEAAKELADRMLADVAEALRRVMREADRLFRLDQEEFLLLLPETDEAGAQICARRMADRVAELRFGDVRASVRAGTATFPAADVLAPEDLVRRASQSLAGPKAAAGE